MDAATIVGNVLFYGVNGLLVAILLWSCFDRRVSRALWAEKYDS